MGRNIYKYIFHWEPLGWKGEVVIRSASGAPRIGARAKHGWRELMGPGVLQPARRTKSLQGSIGQS